MHYYIICCRIFKYIFAIFIFVIGIYALVLGLRFLLKRGSKSEADVVKNSKERMQNKQNDGK